MEKALAVQDSQWEPRAREQAELLELLGPLFAEQGQELR